MRNLIALFALLNLCACTTTNVKLYKPGANGMPASEVPAADASLDEVGIIDAHIHIDEVDAPIGKGELPGATKQQFLDELKSANVVAAVSHEPTKSSHRADIKEVKYIRCIGIGNKVKHSEIERKLKSGQNRCIKIYLGYYYHYANDDLYTPVYRLAEKYNVPVVFHTGDTYDANGKVKYADPLFVDEVAVNHRKVKFVIAHAGNPWIQSAAEVAYKNENVYLDVSAFMIGDMNELPAEKVQTYVIAPIRWVFGYVENPKKVMFGSDWPLSNIKAYADAVKKAIPREHWRAVFHDNAADVFGL